MKKLFIIVILLASVMTSFGWKQLLFRGFDPLIEQADIIVVAEVRQMEKKSYMDGIQMWTFVCVHNLKGEAPLNELVDIGIQAGNIPPFFGFYSDRCILFLRKRSQDEMKFIVCGNQRDFLPISSKKENFSRFKGISVEDTIQTLIREYLTEKRESINKFEKEIQKYSTGSVPTSPVGIADH